MTKLEQMQERVREVAKTSKVSLMEITSEQDYGFAMKYSDLDQIITEVWNEAIKECEVCVPEKRIAMLNTGEKQLRYDDGHNSCREQTLQAISQLYDQPNH